MGSCPSWPVATKGDRCGIVLVVAFDGRSYLIVEAKRVSRLTWPALADVLDVPVETLQNQCRRSGRSPYGPSVVLCELILEGAPEREGEPHTWSSTLGDRIARARRKYPDTRGGSRPRAHLASGGQVTA